MNQNEHANTHGGSHITVGSYLIGFALAVILTVASFVLVMSQSLTPQATVVAIALLAFIQVIVHLKFFLHLDFSEDERWNRYALYVTIFFVSVIVAGTLFVMWNIAMNMMSR
ncbi:cytochrome o ubiquinol oxidase subunit IV [Entomobacter blattae]|uniref:Cytochrome bo(3) ubiquinol oxidase subunit 4 n=1 Tax=Entomobacter blattae TaxID=2762277 RepID=A0A7H1NRY2_9PROT|nr:cytochrome o ubiquinol oxidase subunit IV [Entomobacter blattae]QNT78542.1 Cytochrome bo(3) ubiquinol oxidase subunit 4 [Entomobacter blattae]